MTPGQAGTTVIIPTSRYLFAIARQAHGQVAVIGNKRSIADRSDPCLTAILFSVLAFEGFINELAVLVVNEAHWVDTNTVQSRSWLPQEGSSTKTLGYLLDIVEERRASTAQKLRLISLILTNQEYDSSGYPFQDLHLLWDVRDSLVHLKPIDRINDDWHLEGQPILDSDRRIVGRLAGRRHAGRPILASERVGDRMFIDLISTSNAARWACDVIIEVVDRVIEMVPEQDLKDYLRDANGIGYSRSFARIT